MKGLSFDITQGLKRPWKDMAPTILGRAVGEPQRHVLVSLDGRPRLRLDIGDADEPEYVHTTAAVAWRGLLAIGHGERLYTLAPSGGPPRVTKLSIYFSAFEIIDDEALLAVTGQEIIRLDPDGEIVWRSPALGVDGVIIHDIEDGVIAGDGEWDPPGGWRPFRIRLSDGAPIA